MMEKWQKRHKTMASVVVVMLLATCMAGIATETLYDDEETTVDALPIIPLWMLAMWAISAIAGYVVGHYAFPPGYSGPNVDAIIRGNEAALVSQNIALGGAFYDNALDNYSQIWMLTNEHWIRQAELIVSAIWSPAGDYDPTEVMFLSTILENSAKMLRNSSAQVNEHYRDIGTFLDQWNGIDGFADNMELRISLGNSLHYGSKTNWAAAVGSAVPQVTAGHDKVYISGGKMWSSAATTIKSADGQSVALYQGWNDLATISSFSNNIYTLPAGVQFLGEGILPLLEASAADVYAGMVFKVGTTEKLIHYYNGHVYDGGQQYNSVSIDILPTGATATTNDITVVLAAYGAMLNAVTMSMVAASSAASALWNVFDNMGAASAYLTTLMVPDTYANVNVSPVQKEAITLMAVRQLSDYWVTHSGQLKTTDFVMTNGSLSLYMRGDIKTAQGKMIAENAIFSPFFYRDVTLTQGNNTVNGPAFVAIWTFDAPPLSGWDYSMNINDAAIVDLYTGDTIYGYEIEYDGQIVTHVDLDVYEIDIINPNEIRHDPLPIPPHGGTDWLPIILVVVGVILILIGIAVPSIRPLAYLGIIIAGIGALLYLMSSFSVWSFIGLYISGKGAMLQ